MKAVLPKETSMSARSKMLAVLSIFSLATSLSFAASSSRSASSYAQGLALTFQQNRGQAPAQVQYLTRQSALDLFLNRTESVFNFLPTSSANGAVLRTTLLDSNDGTVVRGEEMQ